MAAVASDRVPVSDQRHGPVTRMCREPHQATWIRVIALAAVALGTLNVVGGFVVTDRMLEMFKKKKPDEAGGE